MEPKRPPSESTTLQVFRANLQKSNIIPFTGGKSTFSLGWGNDMVEEKPTTKVYRNQSNIFGNDEPTKPLAEKKTTAPTYSAPYTTTEPTKTSVKVHYAPGGQSSISFGDSTTTTAPVKKENLKPQDQFNFGPMRKFSSLNRVCLPSYYLADTKTSVKVHNPPGGKSSFSLF